MRAGVCACDRERASARATARFRADFIPEMEETGVKQIQDINMQAACVCVCVRACVRVRVRVRVRACVCVHACVRRRA